MDAGAGSVGIVPVQPGRHVGGALGGAGVGPAVEPFVQRGLDEALGLAVGARPLGPGGQVAGIEFNRGRREGLAASVAEGIVGHDPLDPDAEAREPGGGAGEEAGAARAVLVGQQLDVGQARGAVDRDTW